MSTNTAPPPKCTADDAQITATTKVATRNTSKITTHEHQRNNWNKQHNDFVTNSSATNKNTTASSPTTPGVRRKD